MNHPGLLWTQGAHRAKTSRTPKTGFMIYRKMSTVGTSGKAHGMVITARTVARP